MNKQILEEWGLTLNKYQKLNLEDAKMLYEKYLQTNDDVDKKTIREKIIMATLYNVYEFIKNSELIYFHANSYDMNDIISICTEIWINKIDAGILLKVNKYKDIFNYDFYQSLLDKLNIPKMKFGLISMDLFVELLKDYIMLKQKYSVINFEMLLNGKENNIKYTRLINEFRESEKYFNSYILLFEAIYNSLMCENDIDIKVSKLEKIKYILIYNGLEYLKESTNGVVVYNSEDEIIRKIVNEQLRKIFLEDDAWREKDKVFLTKRFGFDDGTLYSYEEIGKLCGVTAVRIRQIEEKVLRKLRNHTRVKKIKEVMNGEYNDK